MAVSHVYHKDIRIQCKKIVHIEPNETQALAAFKTMRSKEASFNFYPRKPSRCLLVQL